MVYAVAFSPISKMEALKSVGVDDSKKLTEAYREDLFADLTSETKREWLGWAVKAISAKEISEGMLRYVLFFSHICKINSMLLNRRLFGQSTTSPCFLTY
jgi:ribonuclease HII